MRSPAAQILETALALQRTPGERFRLRERPLPPGVVHAIEVAAGSPPVVQAAAEELGEPEPVLVEAARFYLEQVLFADPEADAYRVMGLACDATPEAIRTHHRWLQRWLHPDRAQAGDASVFATRVNQAFAQLRSPESRHAYDLRLTEARLAVASARLAPETVRHWEHEDDAPKYGRRSRWLLAAALVSCIVLAALILRNPDRIAQWNPDAGGDIAAAPEDSGPAIEDRDLGVLGAAFAVAPSKAAVSTPDAASAPAAKTPSQAPVAAPSANPLRAIVAAAPRPLRHAPEPRAAVVPTASSVSPASQPPPPELVDAQFADAQSIEAAPPPPPTHPPAAIRAEDAALVAARLPLAEQRVAQLAGYLASRPGAVPLWDTVQAMAETNEVRQRINARRGSKLELGRPGWRMRPDQATFDTDYRCRSADGAPCGGRMEVTLIWREGLWLVRGVTVGPSA